VAEYHVQSGKHGDFHSKVGIGTMLVKALWCVIIIGYAFLIVAAILWF
jgi:hypothetical protein